MPPLNQFVAEAVQTSMEGLTTDGYETPTEEPPYSCSPSLRTTRPSPYPVSPKTHRMPIRTIGRTEASTATPGSSLADRLSKQKPAADAERTEVTEMIIDDEEELLDRLGKPKEGHLEMD